MLARIIKSTKLFLLIGALLTGVFSLINCSKPQPTPAVPVKFGISGFLLVVPSRASGPDVGFLPAKSLAGIYMPDIEVELRDLLAQKAVESVRTDLSGRLRFSPQQPGRYQVCWKARGITSACNQAFSLSASHVYLGPIPVTVDLSNNARTFYGTVRLADGHVPRTLEPMLGINAFATVTVKDDRGDVLGRSFVNNFGDYVLPGVQQVNSYHLVGNIESADVTQDLSFPSNLSQRVNLVFKQHAPKIRGLIGNNPSGNHWTAAPGDLVQVRAVATDSDGDSLHYSWILPDGSAVPNAPSGDTVSFQLPSRGGVYEFTAVVSDARGGYSKESLLLSTEGVRFGGTITATDAATVPGAEIEINGKTTQSDPIGHFSVFVPESSRYVMNVRKSGYGLVSRVYDNGITGGRWTLTRASAESVDPKQPIDVVNKRVPSDCPGALSDRQRDKATGEQSSQYSRTDQHECGPGIRLRIPTNALVDSDGQPPAGNVRIELATVDLRAPDGMPGDYTVRAKTGDVHVMESYGAGTVEIVGNGKKYNLKPGSTAEITIPIDPAQLTFPHAIQNSIPLLSYDEKAGVWVEEGFAQRVGNAYVGTVKHLSAVNADTLKINQACIRLETVLLPPQFNLEATIPQSSGPPQVKTSLIDNANQRFHVIYNLPTNNTVNFRVFDLNNVPVQLIDIANPNVPITQVNVDSGGPQNPTTPNLPEFPYAACQVSAELTPFQPVGQAGDLRSKAIEQGLIAA